MLHRYLSVGAIAAVAVAAGLSVLAQQQSGQRDARLADALALERFTLDPVTLPHGLPESLAVSVSLNGEDRILHLYRHSLRAGDYRLRVPAADGLLHEVSPPPVRTYRGFVEGLPGTRIAATLLEGGLAATIVMDDGVLWHIQPAEPPDGSNGQQHVLYRDTDTSPGAWTCGTDLHDVVGGDPPGDTGTGVATGLLTAAIAFDADVEYYLDNGSSVSDTVADIETVLNSVSTIYVNAFGITYEIAETIVRTQEPDPYTSSISLELLNEMTAEWNGNQGDVDRAVAHLMTGKDLEDNIVGRAFVGVICTNPPFSYGVTQSRYTPNLGLRAALTAHELGHNWRANHCGATGPACGGPWNDDCSIMCACIGLCTGKIDSFGVPATNMIFSQIGQADCLEPPCIDLNGDGVVNSIDLTLLLSCLGETPDTCPYPGADVNGDGIVNFTDLALLISVFGAECPA